MSPKRKKVEAALKNLFSNKPAVDDEKQPSNQITESEQPQETQPVAVKKPEVQNPKPKRTRKTVPTKEPLTKAEPSEVHPAQGESSAPEPAIVETIPESEVVSVPAVSQPEPVEVIKQTETPVEMPVSAPKENLAVPKAVQEKPNLSEETTKAVQEEVQLVVFELDHEYFGVEIALVESIIKMQPYTIVPHTPEYLVGVTNLRGYVLPVVDLRKRFNLPALVETAETRIMVLMLNGEKVGMIVDGVNEVARVLGGDIDPTPKLVTNINMDFIQGIAKLRTEDGKDVRMAILLDMEKVLKTK